MWKMKMMVGGIMQRAKNVTKTNVGQTMGQILAPNFYKQIPNQ